MEILPAVASALWLGILTSISPCPLATNIAAVSFLSKKVVHPTAVFISGLAYTLGRMSAYTALGWVIISSLLSVPQVAQFLQKYMVKLLGPILIITGLFLLEAIRLKLPYLTLSQENQNKLVESGTIGSFVLGLIFALAFCPVSAALFFGSLIPLALNNNSGISLVLIYGIGTGLPVLIFAVTIALGLTFLNHWFRSITRFEYYTRKITGVIFIIVGSYYFSVYILKLF